MDFSTLSHAMKDGMFVISSEIKSIGTDLKSIKTSHTGIK